MAKFELSLAKDYVPSWTFVDAVREFFQNALDQETVLNDNKMFIKYNKEDKQLVIGNKKSVLETKSLLLGASTKSNDEKTIGQFGEGYKIGTLVLTRENHPVTFYNYGNKEVWRPRFVKSKRYNAEILTFFTDKKYPWQKQPHNNLEITIDNITEVQYEKIKESNLHLQDIGEVIKTEKGNILLEDKYKGKVYVNGLFVCDYGNYEHGYDFKPGEINIDRDRKLVNSFDLKWLASNMWAAQEGYEIRTAELIKKNTGDVEYITSHSHVSPGFKTTTDTLYNDFKEQYGERAVPVSSQEEMESLADGYKPVLVSYNEKTVMEQSALYKRPEFIIQPALSDKLEDWLTRNKQYLPEEAITEMENIIKQEKEK